MNERRKKALCRTFAAAARGSSAVDRPGQFVADLNCPHAACGLRRSPVAHAGIRWVDLARAAAAPGVVYALSGVDLLRLLPPVPDTQLSLPRKWTTLVQHKFHNPQQPLLANDKVRHVGEAIAVILAESRYAAEDAAELVDLELEPLPAVVDVEAALAPGAPIMHEQFHTNLIGEFAIAKGDIDAALAAAPHRLQRRFYPHRYAAMPMECRGVVSARSAHRYDDDLVLHPGRALGAARGRVRSAASGSARPLPRARRRRRLRRQRPRLSRGSADPVPRPHDRPSGALDRGPA